MSASRRPWLWRYGSAALALLLATLARWLLDPILADQAPFPTYFMAIMLVAWYSGLGPSMLTFVGSALLADYFFIPPRGSILSYRLQDGVGLALYLIAGLTIALLSESLRSSRASLEQRMIQLRRLAGELTHSEHRERRRLAQVLHDHLQQLLLAARLKVSMLQRRAANEAACQPLGEIEGLLDQAIAESRSLAVDLCPPVLHNAGLAAALEWLARETEKKLGLAVEATANRGAEPADEATRVFLFQAVRELLLNVVKHAQASRARVLMCQAEDGMLRIEVSDDGIGCDPARLRQMSNDGGFGLFSVRERLELLNGRIEVETAPSKGTRVVLMVPGEQPESARQHHEQPQAKPAT